MAGSVSDKRDGNDQRRRPPRDQRALKGRSGGPRQRVFYWLDRIAWATGVSVLLAVLGAHWPAVHGHRSDHADADGRSAHIYASLLSERTVIDAAQSPDMRLPDAVEVSKRTMRLMHPEAGGGQLVDRCGWPLRAFSATTGGIVFPGHESLMADEAAIMAFAFRGGAPMRLLGPASDVWEVAVLPMRPIWWGLIGNILIWFALLECGARLIAIVDSLRSRRRLRQGLCPVCRYDISSAEMHRCPECGWGAAGPTVRRSRLGLGVRIGAAALGVVIVGVTFVGVIQARPASTLEGMIRSHDAAGVQAALAAMDDGVRREFINSATVTSAEITPLMLAARVGDPEIMSTLIEAGMDVRARSSSDAPTIVYAILSRRADAVQCALEHGADPNARFDFNGAPLHLALETGAYEVIKALLEAGADPNAEVPGGSTALSVLTTIPLADTSIVRLIVEHGADPNWIDSVTYDRPILLWAISAGNMTMAMGLLEVGADVNASDSHGLTPLMEATLVGAEATQMLIDAGADVHAADSDGFTALIHAAFDGPESVTRLLEAGADVNAASHDGLTALMCAAMRSAAITQVLVDAGADQSARDDGGMTARDYAESRLDGDELRAVLEVLDLGERAASMSGQRFSAEEMRRATASMRASISADDAAGVEEAIRRGAVPDEGLHFAVRESSPACVQALLRFVSDVDVRTEMYTETALSVASFYSTPEIVRLLLDAGADPDGAPDDVEEAPGAFVSPLAQVVLRASLSTSDVDTCQQIVVALIERGASTDVELAGVPILIEAIESVPPVIVEALLEGG